MQINNGRGGAGNSSYIPPPHQSSASAAAAAAAMFNDQGGLFGNHHPSRLTESLDLDVRALTMAREMEKSKIREEILQGGLLRRRELELEVISELRMEEDSLKRRRTAGEGLSLVDTQFLPESMGDPLLSRRERFGLGLDGSSSGLIRPEPEAAAAIDGRSSRMEGGTVLGAYPFQRQPGAAATAFAAAKPSNEAGSSKGQVIPLVKQHGNMTSIIAPPAKRVAETSIASSRDNSLSSDITNKRLKIEYKCSLCQVTATCEQGLLDHINGRKHKAKESAENFQKMTEGSGSSSQQHQILPTNNNGTPKHKTGVLQIIERVTDTKEPEDSKATNGGDDDDAVSEESEKEMPSEYRNIYKCWCVICSIGTTSEAMMEAHCGGRKHKHALLKNGGGLVVIKTTPDLVADQKDAADQN